MNKSFLMLLVLVIFLGAGFGGSFVGGVIYGQTLEADSENGLSPRLGAAGQASGGGEGAPGGQRGQGRQGQGGPAGASRDGAGQSGETQGGGRPVASQQAGGSRGAGEGQPSEQAIGGGESGRQRADSDRATQGETPAVASEPEASPNAPNSDPREPETGAEGPGGRVSASDNSGTPPAGRGGISGTVQGLEGEVLTVSSPRGELAVTLADGTTIYQVGEATRETLTEGVKVRVSGFRNAEGGVSAQAVIILPEGAENLFGTGGPSGRQRGPGS